MSALLKLLIVFALSSVKFLLAPPLSFGMGLNFVQTLASTSAGGIMGVFLFFYLSRSIIRLYDTYCRKYVHEVTHSVAGRLNVLHLAERHFPLHRKRKKVFTFTNRLIVRIRRKYGFIGIIILTPVLLSIPVGTFLAARFYPKKQYIVLYLSASVVFWSLLMSSAIAIF
ncbi:MAG: hypothetical protein IPH45_07430 [Bacteroidales bacterium]|nr:hypothetical protein [Bacteroidales bacterium]